MLCEYLSGRSLRTLIKLNSGIFPPAVDRTAWMTLPAAMRQEIAQLAQDYREQPYPMRRATDFLAFVRNGSRKADENPYFFRRRKLCAAALGYCLEPNAQDLDEVIDGLWCICEEISWVISAHNVNPVPGAPSSREYPLPDKAQPYIDLFTAQTGMVLSLVFDLMADALDATSDSIRRVVEGEILQRILEPFMATDDFWWMGVKRTDLNNWTPWILSNVMLTAECWMRDQTRLSALLERACAMLDRWLACVPEDGGCDEGAGYWNMAGGALLDCLDVLERVTGGEMTFWQDEKLRRILSFPAKAQVAGHWFVNFADCDARPYLSGERLQWAGEKLGDARLTALGVELRGTLADEINDTPNFSRMLNKLFHPAVQAADAPGPVDTWLPKLQLRMVERGGLTLCCHGGHNGESHNHNDVGSFMLYVDGEPQLVDAGNMVYTAKTFSAERYTLWNTRSAYHNLPMIGGQEQLPGSEHTARDVACLPEGLSLDMAGAYPPGGTACRRTMRLTEKGLAVEDAIDLQELQDATWVFMLRHQPEVCDGSLKAGSVCLHFNAELTAAVEEIPITDARMQKNFPGSLWRVMLSAPPAESHRQAFLIERCAAHE